MNRLYAGDRALSREARVIIDGQQAHYIMHVLRLRTGRSIRLFNSSGLEFEAVVTEVRGGRVELLLGAQVENDVETAVRYTVAQALARGDRMDFVLQKCTEIGASEFIIYPAYRTLSRADADVPANRMVRWRRIVEEAAEQSQRLIVPAVTWLNFESLLSRVTASPCSLAAWEGSTHPLRDTLRSLEKRPDGLMLIIGPEGGLAAEEVEALHGAGAEDISLGPRILRTETAGAVMLAATIYELEGF